MANEEHLAILKKGVKTWNKWREQHPGVIPDLSGDIINNWYFKEAEFKGTSTNSGVYVLESTHKYLESSLSYFNKLKKQLT